MNIENAMAAKSAMDTAAPRRRMCRGRAQLLNLLAVQSPLTLHFEDFPAARLTTAHTADVATPADLARSYNRGPVAVTWHGAAHDEVFDAALDDCSNHGVRGR